jgi:hypothetical protein
MYPKFQSLLIMGLLFSIVPNSLAQNAFLLPNDTCMIPCWMGLIPGESGNADVLRLIDEQASAPRSEYGELDDTSELVQNGIYGFSLEPRSMSHMYAEIEIQDDIVNKIKLRPTVYNDYHYEPPVDEFITLAQVISNLGQPDYVDYANPDYRRGSREQFTLIYVQFRIRIEIDSLDYNCSLEDMANRLVVHTMSYYSHDAARELDSYVGYVDPQEALTVNGFNEYDIDLDIWQQALDGLIEGDCIELFRRSPQADRPGAPSVYAEPSNVESLFREDSCFPPCWFGLVAGESNSNDIAVMIENYAYLFRTISISPDSIEDNTGNVLTGNYTLRWTFYEREDLVDFGVAMKVDEGQLSYIYASVNRVVLLSEVLQKLGTPDYITMNWGDLVGEASLQLSYFSYHIRIELEATSICQLARIGSDFWVTNVMYYSPDSPEESMAFDRRLKTVPQDQWQLWLSGLSNESCLQAWIDL